MASLTNKIALVTGASRGIGRATASALADAGAHVLVHYARSAQDAESLVAGIRSKGGRADAIRADLGTADGATLLAREVRQIVGERLDVLVCNAGISKAATIAADPVAFVLGAFFSPSESSQAAGREYLKRLESRKEEGDLLVSNT
jgi:3-oxoacyl-[acyl-carrier protein] reductase